MPPQNIPGFIYDETKKKYFKMVNGPMIESTSTYHNSTSQAEKRKRTRSSERLKRTPKTYLENRGPKTSKDAAIEKLVMSLNLYRQLRQDAVDKLDITSIRIGLRSYKSNLTLLRALLKEVKPGQIDDVQNVYEFSSNGSYLPDCIVFKHNWTLTIIRENETLQVESPNPELNVLYPGNFPSSPNHSALWFCRDKQEIRIAQFRRELQNEHDINLTNYFVFRHGEWHQEEVLLRYLAERKGLDDVCKLIGKGKNFHDFVTCCKLLDEVLIFGSSSGQLVIMNILKLHCLSEKLAKASIVYISDILHVKGMKSVCVGTHNGHLFFLEMNGTIIYKLKHTGSIKKVFQIDPKTILVFSTTQICTYSLLFQSAELIREFNYCHDNLPNPLCTAFFWNRNCYFIVSELRYKLRLYEVLSGSSVEFFDSVDDQIVNVSITAWGHVYLFMLKSHKEFKWTGVLPQR